MVDKINKTLEAKYKALAAGKDQSLTQVDSNGQPKEWPTAPACEILKTPPEFITNFKGFSCGTTAPISANGIDLTKPNKAEDSYRGGANVSAIKCYARTVLAELQTSGRISNIPVACEPLAEDLRALFTQSNEAWNALLARKGGAAGTRNLCSSKMISDFASLRVPESCRDGSATVSEEEVTETTDLRQGACYLAAARAALYDATQRLTLCTIFKNAELSVRSIFEGEGNPFDKWVAEVYSPAVASHTRSAVRSNCKPLFRRSCIRNTIQSAASAFHKEQYGIRLREFLAPYFPANAPQGGACHRP